MNTHTVSHTHTHTHTHAQHAWGLKHKFNTYPFHISQTYSIFNDWTRPLSCATVSHNNNVAIAVILSCPLNGQPSSIYTLTDFTLYVFSRYWYIFLSCVRFQVLIHTMADFSRKLTAEISSICCVIDGIDEAIIVSLRLNSYQDISIWVTYVFFSRIRGNLQ